MAKSNPTTAPPIDALLRLDDVLARIPVSRSTFYAGQNKGLFPKPIRIGPRARAYRFADISAWLADPEKWQQEHCYIESKQRK